MPLTLVSLPRPTEETLPAVLLGHVKGCSHKHVPEFGRIDHQPRDLGNAADVLDSIDFGRAKILVKAVVDVVAVVEDQAKGRHVLVRLTFHGPGAIELRRRSGQPIGARGRCHGTVNVIPVLFAARCNIDVDPILT